MNKSKDGTLILLRDVAKVTLSKSHDFFRATANGKEAIVAAISAAPSANSITIAKNVTQLLPRIEKKCSKHH